MPADRLEFRVLGPLDVRADGASVPIGGPKRRALLGLLLLNANRVVPIDQLLDELDGDGEPGGDGSLRVQVSRLRKALAPDGGEPRLVARAPGYLLRVEPGELDLERFEQSVADGRRAAADGDPARAAELLRAGLSLWRGRPFADLEFEPLIRIEIDRLEELRLTAIEERVDADLARGEHAALVAELEALTAEHPLRERLREQLMLALYRCGRQAEALDLYRATRRMLDEELGLEPGIGLQKLERAILAHDEALDAATAVAVAPLDERLSVCPFKGLAPFEAADAPFFFGRERLVDELVARLAEGTFVAVLGASGSGKSSLLRAGILPALAAGALPGSETWHQVVLRPGEHPRLATRDLSEERRLVVAVDQFEELFTACKSEDERRAFVAALVEAAWDPGRRATVLIAMRADFFGRLAELPELAELVGASHVLLRPMSDRDLRRAIEGPAERAGLVVEPELVSTLVADTAAESGGLPLLSTALLELWQERDGRMLRLTTYDAMGRVPAAVARLAETAYGRLDEAQQRIARRILLRLAGDDDGALVRRRVPLAELDVPRNADVSRVLNVLADRRLLTVGDGTAEVAHEALLTHWPRLRDWLGDDAAGRQLHRHLSRAAVEWAASGREPAELYRGARLSSALEWQAEDRLNDLEREFIGESRDAAQRDEARQRRANRRLRSLLGAAVVLLALAIAAGAVAFDKRGQARRQATAADAQRLGAQALLQPYLDRSLLLAREAVDLDDSLATRGYLLAALLRAPAAIAIANLDGVSVYDEALSPDGRTLAVRGEDGNVLYFDARTLRRRGGAPLGEGQVAFIGGLGPPRRALAFSPDGTTLAMGSTDGTHALLHLIARGASHARVTVDAKNTSIPDLAFAPDGRTLATGEVISAAVNPKSELIVLRTTRTGLAERESKSFVSGRLVGYTGDGRYLLVTTGDRTSTLLDPTTLKPVRTLHIGAPAALAPRGSLAAFGHTDGSVTLLDVPTGKETTLSGRTGSEVDSLGFSADGQRLATGDDDGTVGIWDVHAGTLLDVYHGHSAAVQAVTFSPDGRTLYSGSFDGSVIAWDVSGTRRLGRPFLVTPDPGFSFAGSDVSPDGSMFAASPGPNEVALWRSATRTVIRRLRGPVGDSNGMRFSVDGTLLGVAGSKHAVVWDVRTGNVVRVFPVGSGPHANSASVAFSPDGRVLAVVGAGDAIRLYDLRTGDQLVKMLGGDGTPQEIDFSPDGKLLASATLTGHADLWDVATGRSVATLANSSTSQVAAFALRFSPDGKLLAVGDTAGNVVLWDVATRQPFGRPLAGHNGAVHGVGFDPSGRTLVTTSDDGNLRLWDVATQKLIGAPIPASAGGGSAEFFPDGTHVLGVFGGGTGVVWNVDPAAWEAQACRTANRDLTRAEWSDFLGGRAYRPVCGA